MRPSPRHVLVLCTILLVPYLTTVPVAAATTTQAHHHTMRRHGATRRHGSTLLSRLCGRMLQLLNEDRADAGVGPLALDRLLTRVALGHSRDMALHHYFAHDSRDGADPFTRMTRMGVPYADAGENIGQAFRLSAFAALATLDAQMMAEPLVAGTHHDIIVNALYRRVGIGIFLSPSRALYLTEDFTN